MVQKFMCLKMIRKKQISKKAGTYEVYAKYFASHQDSTLTGATSALLWTIVKNPLTGKKTIQLNTVRLDTFKEKTKVGTVEILGAQWEGIKQNFLRKMLKA